MEKRKNPEKELKNKQGLFFNMGLLIAMMLCVSAFEYETRDVVVCPFDLEPEKVETYLPPVTIHDDIPKPPKPKKVKLPDLTRVKAADPVDVMPTTIPDIEMPPATDGPLVYTEPAPEIQEVIEPFLIVEKMPEYEGGISAFYNYIYKNLRYPNQARNLNIEGKVFIQFVIDENGKLTDLVISKGIGAGCDEEVLRVFANAPNWIPGKQRGVPVKVRQSMAINFQMN